MPRATQPIILLVFAEVPSIVPGVRIGSCGREVAVVVALEVTALVLVVLGLLLGIFEIVGVGFCPARDIVSSTFLPIPSINSLHALN